MPVPRLPMLTAHFCAHYGSITQSKDSVEFRYTFCFWTVLWSGSKLAITSHRHTGSHLDNRTSICNWKTLVSTNRFGGEVHPHSRSEEGDSSSGRVGIAFSSSVKRNGKLSTSDMCSDSSSSLDSSSEARGPCLAAARTTRSCTADVLGDVTSCSVPDSCPEIPKRPCMASESGLCKTLAAINRWG
jgi:hypothetical protein